MKFLTTTFCLRNYMLASNAWKRRAKKLEGERAFGLEPLLPETVMIKAMRAEHKRLPPRLAGDPRAQESRSEHAAENSNFICQSSHR
jgi:hypothetical protein